jgi:hypothetical protein
LVIFSNIFISDIMHCEQFDISDEFGLFCGGAHLAAAVR